MSSHYLFAQAILCEHAMLTGVVKLAPGTFNTILKAQDGSVWSSGGHSKRFVRVIPGGATAVASGTGYSIVLKQGGYMWAMGENSKGQLGNSATTNKDTFFFVRRIPGAQIIAAGGYHSLLLTVHNGRVWATGWNKYGQLGDGSTIDKIRFFRVISTGMKVVGVAAGDSHSIVLRRDGSVLVAGRNNNGQLGDGSRNDRCRFVTVMFSGAADVHAGSYHTMVRKKDGSVWATGWNEYGQLGDESTTDRMNYVKVVETGAKAIAAGSRHSMMLKRDGSVWATGYNLFGQLGDGRTSNIKVFVQVISEGVTEVAAGASYSMVIKEDGSIWATGSNEYGQFGDGSTVSQKNFVRLREISNSTGH